MLKPVFGCHQCSKPKKISGKPHNRQAELIAYRENIGIANDKILECAEKKDITGMELWNKIIDDAQANIKEIIMQEDGYKNQQYDNYTNMSKTAVDFADKAVDIGGKAIKLGALAGIGSKIAAPTSNLSLVA